jgi:pimeloyl-ACP methyl ester carboxylesterase
MKVIRIFCLALIAFATFAAEDPAVATPVSKTQHNYTYVIVHGAWGGGWDWKRVDDLLTADGQTVYRPTLSGMGEHSNFTGTNIDLNTHIQDIVNVLEWENLQDVVLVGHSYGGMVITGVADRVPGRIKHLVYIDAIVPENGESVNSLRVGHGRHPVKDGFVIPTWVPPNTPPPHDVPQPAATFSQPITLTNQITALKIPTTYILAVDPGKQAADDDFYRFYQRAQTHAWKTEVIESDHVVERSHPREIARLLEQVP